MTLPYSRCCDACGATWSSSSADSDCSDCLGLALLADLSDEQLAEVQELVLQEKRIQAAKVMVDATRPRHSLQAAIIAIGMMCQD